MKVKNKNLIFGLVGPTGSGKTELSKHLRKKHGFLYIPSVTTRPSRKGNLSEYKHVRVEIFEQFIKNGELLEYSMFAGHYYGKLRKDIDNYLKKGHSIYTLTFDRTEKLKNEYSDTKIICILPEDPIIKTVERRLKNRGDCLADIQKRLKTIEKDLKLIEKLKSNKMIDHFVRTLNCDWNHAISEIDKIANLYK
jgi:guanylate kinase